MSANQIKPKLTTAHEGICDWCEKKATSKLQVRPLAEIWVRACPDHHHLLGELRETAPRARLGKRAPKGKP